MIRNAITAAGLLFLVACQTVGAQKVAYNAQNAEKIMQAAYDVCISNIGNADKMQSDVRALTGDTPQSKRVRVEGEWYDIDHYRYYDDDEYLAFFSVYRNGKGCAANYATGAVPQHIVTQGLSIEWGEGKYNKAQFGKVRSKDVGVEYIQRIQGEAVFDMILFLDKEWTQVETSRTGAPDIKWQ